MPAPPRARLLALAETASRVFATTFNPTGIRTGNKILRQRLKGPTLAAYYPRREVTVQDLKRAWPYMDFPDEHEEMRQAAVEKAKSRGKGAPKKIREKPNKPTKKK